MVWCRTIFPYKLEMGHIKRRSRLKCFALIVILCSIYTGFVIISKMNTQEHVILQSKIFKSWSTPVVFLSGVLKLSANNNTIEQQNDRRLDQQMQTRGFTIDYDNDQFLMDGKPFRFVGGSFHYFRSVPGSWRRKLRAMRAGGLNVLTTYVEWALHNPKDGVYDWEGMADLERFIQEAVEEDLYVILRPGPYICAERDMGGFPYWLLHKYPNISLRTYDPAYLREVEIWYRELMPRMERYLYGNGGPIIMVQVENEYGSFRTIDQKYKEWLRDLTQNYVQDKAVLFTNDNPGPTPKGVIPGVLATLDFGAGDDASTKAKWDQLRKYKPKGPLVNIEYYPGWLTHWQESMNRGDTTQVANTLRYMLRDGASVNFYMYYGGTNFGFTAGANDGGPNSFNADITSYDYDAPLTEAGDITPKYLALRDVIGEFLPLPDLPIPQNELKMALGPVQMKPISVLLSNYARRTLNDSVVQASGPLTFEALNQFSGLVLYETELPKTNRDPAVLHVEKIHDRGYVYVDRTFVGILSRENGISSLSVPLGLGKSLQIVVENQGRINFNIPNDFKGIIGSVSYNNRKLSNWTMTKFPLDEEKVVQMVQKYLRQPKITSSNGKSYIRTGPSFFHGTFRLDSEIRDTFLNPIGWGKGVAFINGFNLGRYWPLVGPQITLYVPKEVLKPGENEIILLEYQKVSDTDSVYFTNTPELDGKAK